jgi:hypothetical protein
MEVSGQLHASAALLQVKKSSAPIRQDTTLCLDTAARKKIGVSLTVIIYIELLRTLAVI